MTTTTTINQLPTGTLSDSMVFPAEQGALVGNATSQITALQIRNYIAANVPVLTLNVSNGTAPFNISSSTLVPNLYVARANVADTTTNGLTTASVLSGTGDLAITGNYNNLTTTLSTVNATTGTFGGKLTNSFIIPSIQVNSKGLVTSIANVFVTTPQFQGMTSSGDITPTATSNIAVNLGGPSEIGRAHV